MDLKEIREHLDRVDNSLLFLLAEKMSLIPKVAEYKKRTISKDINRKERNR